MKNRTLNSNAEHTTVHCSVRIQASKERVLRTYLSKATEIITLSRFIECSTRKVISHTHRFQSGVYK